MTVKVGKQSIALTGGDPTSLGDRDRPPSTFCTTQRTMHTFLPFFHIHFARSNPFEPSDGEADRVAAPYTLRTSRA